MSLATLTRPSGKVAQDATAPVSSPLLSTSFGTATKATAKGSPGLVMAVVVTNANAALRFLQLHNKITAPAGGDVPVVCIPIAAGTAAAPGIVVLGDSIFTLNGLFLAIGVSWAISTTVATFTDAATAAEHTLNLLYY